MARGAPDARFFQNKASFDIAGSASPKQVVWRDVALVTVQVMRFHVPGAAAEPAHFRCGRSAVGMGGAIAGGAVGDCSGRLSPAVTAPAVAVSL